MIRQYIQLKQKEYEKIRKKREKLKEKKKKKWYDPKINSSIYVNGKL